MFDLEQSITEWRRQLLAAGIQTPVPLEELENHLREEIEQQMESAMNEQAAFEISVQQIGASKMIKTEFKKIKRTFMKTFKIIAGFLLGAALQLPGSLQLRDQLAMSDKWLGLWLLGFILQMWAINSLWRMMRSGAAKIEFEKIEMTFSRIAKAGAGVILVLIGTTMTMPAAMQACREGLVKFDALGWLIFGFALLVTGTVITFCPYKKRKA
jgi:hypothetical protein